MVGYKISGVKAYLENRFSATFRVESDVLFRKIGSLRTPTMTKRTDKIAAYLEKAVTEAAVSAFQDGLSETFGIVSVRKVTVSGDLSYADVYVSSTSNSEGLPKALKPLAPKIRASISRGAGVYKSPILRFRVGNPAEAEDAGAKVLALIEELSHEHDSN
jgi:ribosome-binding factor A